MPLSAPRRRVALTLVLVALGVTGCGSSKTTTPSTNTSPTTTATTSAGTSSLVGSHTSVAINPKISQLLHENGITPTAIGPATYTKTLLLPIAGGQIAVATSAGTIDHTGGLKLTRGEKSVELEIFIANTATKQVTALVNEQRMPVFSINTSSENRGTQAGAVIVDSGLKLTLTEQAANTLNSSLGVSAFKAGQEFGTATLTLALKS